ncbi:MAG: carboxypeptidase regulatory-like domain-containing protein, partial [Candidatus Methanoperedens sp.]|nr:carboxypeptidase regulatory-like domain-containing protein [Candidatus Methanoperedens sp.]
GNLVYTPASGTKLNVGAGQTLHVAFTPTDTVNYNTASKDVKINVNQAQTNGGTVQGKVFNDLDHDKKLDKGESGIPDVVIQLTGDEKKNKKIRLVTKTDASGNYIFPNVPYGKYKIHVQTKHGWLYTTSTSKGITIKNGKAIIVNFGEKQDRKTQH